MLEIKTPTRARRRDAPARDAWALDPLESFHREMDRLVDGFGRDVDAGRELAGWQPQIDVREEANAFVVTADLPGVKPEDVELSVRDDCLTLKGRREETRADEGDGWHRRERVTGGFARTIRLPFAIDADRVQAKSGEGVLHIHVPKPETSQQSGARRIPIAQGAGEAR
ncbi:MAG: Hsp20/alpha crystallin family protein [Alphaproteobacteria bacterium]